VPERRDPARGEPDVPYLLARVGTGDESAVRTLLGEYLGDLQTYVRAHSGRRLLAREASQDLVQSICREVLEDAAAGTFEFRGEKQFRGWLFRTALNKIRSKGRFHGRERRGADREIPVQSLEPAAADALFASLHTPSRSAENREERERFFAAFARLSERDQNLIQWVRIDGLSHAEIAARLSVTEGNSRVMLARALARLATLAAE
jgi:RNA polymerase sigma factor (sigma-70 family)